MKVLRGFPPGYKRSTRAGNDTLKSSLRERLGSLEKTALFKGEERRFSSLNFVIKRSSGKAGRGGKGIRGDSTD